MTAPRRLHRRFRTAVLTFVAGLTIVLASPSTALAQLPDLQISAAVAASFQAGQTGVQVPVTVTRSGGNLTNGTFVFAKLFWSTNTTWDGADSELWAANQTTPDFPNSVLNSNGTRTVNATIAIPNVAPGTYYILAVVDPTNFHPETNESNNVTAYAVTIATLPDLRISATVAASYQAGQTGVQVPVTVTRSGGPLTNGTFVFAKLFWSTNTIWDGADSELWAANQTTPDFPNSVLNSNGARTVNATIAIPNVASGTYYILAVVDPTNFHPESNEGNNVSAYAVSVASCTRPAPPALQEPAAGATLAPGNITFRWNASTGANRYRLKIATDPAMSAIVGGAAIELAAGVRERTVNLPAGSYYWQVQGISANETCGWGDYGPSPPRPLTVTAPASEVPRFVPLYRLHHATSGDYLFTTNPVERAQAESDPVRPYVFQRVEGYIASQPFPGSTPLYRLYRSAIVSHYYTTSAAERDARLAAGWVSEGIAGYVFATAVPGSVRLARFRRTTGQPDHFVLVTRRLEHDVLQSTPGWALDGDAGWVSPFGMRNPVAHQRAQASIEGVDSGSGAYRESYEHQGLAFHGVGPAFAFRLHYNSQNFMRHPLAVGWSHSFNAFVLEGLDRVAVRWGNGSESLFARSGAAYTRAPEDPGNYHVLTRVNDGVNLGYDLLTKDQILYRFREFSLSESPDPFAPSVLLIGIRDRHGNEIRLDRNAANGVLHHARDPVGRELRFTYGPGQRLDRVDDSEIGRNLRFGYRADGALETITDARGNVTRFNYDSFGRMVTITRPRGNVRSLEYDDRDRVRLVRDGMNRTVVSLQFDAGGIAGRTQVTPAGFPAAVFDHQPGQHLLTGARDALGNAATLEFQDPSNPTLPTRIVDYRGHATSYTYDNRGNVRTVTNALGRTASFDYDAKNNLTRHVDFGLPVRTTIYTWDAGGNTLRTVQDPEGNISEFTYNARGQMRTARDPEGRVTTYDYDGRFQLASITDALNHRTSYTHDNAGRRRTVTDALSRTTTYGYDSHDQLTQVTDAAGHVVTLRYDANDNLDRISYSRGGVLDAITYGYDTNDRLITVNSPNNETTRYDYNVAGDLIGRTDGLGRRTTYEYDENRRLRLVRYEGSGDSISYIYDGNGNRIEMDESWLPGKHTYVFDALNRLRTHNNTYGVAVGYDYDDAGHRKALIYPGSRTVDYTSDLAGRLQRVTDWLGGHVVYGHDRSGALRNVQHPNGTQSVFSHDSAGRLESITHRRGDSSILARYELTLDPVGNHTVVSGIEPLAPPLPSAADIVYSIGADNRIQSQSDGVAYQYDANGNRSLRTAPAGTTNYSYDFENRLTQVTGPAGTVRHVYDGDGNRIARIQGATTTRYVLDIGGAMASVLAETDESNTARVYYVHGHALLARITPAGQRHVYHADSRGSTVAMTDAGQNMAQRYAYDEFGAVLAAQGGVGENPFQYVGGWGVMAEPDGLQFMRARFYDERAGRFLTKDPIGFEGGDWNLYAYGGGNPLVFVDASGEKFFLSTLRVIAEETLKATVKGLRSGRIGGGGIRDFHELQGFVFKRTTMKLPHALTRHLGIMIADGIYSKWYGLEAAPGPIGWLPFTGAFSTADELSIAESLARENPALLNDPYFVELLRNLRADAGVGRVR